MDSSTFRMPRQHLPLPHGRIRNERSGKKSNLSDQFHISSAATSTEEIGNPVHRGTRAKLAQAGIACEGHHARQMTRADYDGYDYLIGMDEWNIRNIKRITGGDPEGKYLR